MQGRAKIIKIGRLVSSFGAPPSQLDGFLREESLHRARRISATFPACLAYGSGARKVCEFELLSRTIDQPEQNQTCPWYHEKQFDVQGYGKAYKRCGESPIPRFCLESFKPPGLASGRGNSRPRGRARGAALLCGSANAVRPSSPGVRPLHRGSGVNRTRASPPPQREPGPSHHGAHADSH